jgi:hypothetical protein
MTDFAPLLPEEGWHKVTGWWEEKAEKLHREGNNK